MNNYAHIALRLAVLASTASTGAVFAYSDTCFNDNTYLNSFMIGTSKSVAVEKQQARNTWDDWVWRGEEKRCNGKGEKLCQYTWTNSTQTGYEWSAGLKVNFGSVPIIGGFLAPFDASGSYTRIKYITESFSWSQWIDGGYSAYPVKVVVRRWHQGNFKGVWYNNGYTCVMKKENYDPGHKYWWNPNGTFGSWAGNKAVKNVSMIHVFKTR